MIPLRSQAARWLLLLPLLASSVLAQEPDYAAKLKQLGLGSLSGKIPAYYSAGHREHALKLQSALEEMNDYFQQRMGVQANVTLALLDAKDWKTVTGADYQLPQVAGEPRVIMMPATSDNPVFGLMDARKDAIPPAQLQAFLKDHHMTFHDAAAQFVDLLGFHEIGHLLVHEYGIDPKDLWLDEFLASYWMYSYIDAHQPEYKAVFALLGRPSKARPKNTSLHDFERFYSDVDDYGWYQGWFELRIQQMFPRPGLQFLRDLKQKFPRTPAATWNAAPVEKRMPPSALLQQLETIAPGFQKWALAFQPPK